MSHQADRFLDVSDESMIAELKLRGYDVDEGSRDYLQDYTDEELLDELESRGNQDLGSLRGNRTCMLKAFEAAKYYGLESKKFRELFTELCSYEGLVLP